MRSSRVMMVSRRKLTTLRNFMSGTDGTMHMAWCRISPLATVSSAQFVLSHLIAFATSVYPCFSLALTCLVLCHGAGLSYTTFTYSNLQATTTSVSCSVRNSGTVKGAEVAQLYLAFPKASGEPPLQLKGFAKVELEPGVSATVKFPLTDRELSVWSTTSHGWEVAKGSFGVHIGSSSRDLRLNATVVVP